MVPTGTFSTTSAPSCPLRLEPSPWRPRSALYSGLKRKWTKVLWRSLDSMTTSPPLPPSPPEGPPRGTNFSRRKAMQPLPPSPALTRILASSTNIKKLRATSHQLPAKPRMPRDVTGGWKLVAFLRLQYSYTKARQLGVQRCGVEGGDDGVARLSRVDDLVDPQ